MSLLLWTLECLFFNFGSDKVASNREIPKLKPEGTLTPRVLDPSGLKIFSVSEELNLYQQEPKSCTLPIKLETHHHVFQE